LGNMKSPLSYQCHNKHIWIIKKLKIYLKMKIDNFYCFGLDYGPKINSIGPIARWSNFPTYVIQIKDLVGNERRRRHTQRASPSPEEVTAHIWNWHHDLSYKRINNPPPPWWH
jgi:hypothetical protein